MVSEQENTDLDEAKALELDNAHIVLTREQYDAFVKELEKPPRVAPELKKLMRTPSLIDVPDN